MADILSMTNKSGAEKQKALDSALAQIERQFGKGSIMKLGGENPIQEIDSTSTGSLGLDIALGIGGLPKGRIIDHANVVRGSLVVHAPPTIGKGQLFRLPD